jgi:hypothetical protein
MNRILLMFRIIKILIIFYNKCLHFATNWIYYIYKDIWMILLQKLENQQKYYFICFTTREDRAYSVFLCIPMIFQIMQSIL